MHFISVGLVSSYKYQLLGIFKGHALHIIVVYQWALSLYKIISYQVFSKTICFISVSYITGSCLLLFYTNIRYQVFSKTMRLISLWYIMHLGLVMSFAPVYNIRYQVFSMAMHLVSLLYTHIHICISFIKNRIHETVHMQDSRTYKDT